jgi:hypothetical protein
VKTKHFWLLPDNRSLILLPCGWHSKNEFFGDLTAKFNTPIYNSKYILNVN